MPFEISIRPRVSETDMLGHINNVAVMAWFEEGRSYVHGPRSAGQSATTTTFRTCAHGNRLPGSALLRRRGMRP
jgi:hypothetical protein